MISFRSYASSSSGNLHSITDGETTVLIECGLPWKEVQKYLGYKTSEVSAVCLTHEHKDHSRSVNEAARAGIDIYLLPETQATLGLEGHRIHPLPAMGRVKIGSFQVLSFPLQHDAPICGFLFASGEQRAVYITDSYYCKYRFSRLNVIAIECNYSKKTISPDIHPEVKKRLLRSHMSLENCIKFLKANDLSRCQEIHLIHLSRDNSDAEMFKREVQKATGVPVTVASE